VPTRRGGSGRRGEESLPLTEDFVVGRFTVELDGVFLISAVTVELPGGAQVVTVDTSSIAPPR
jgi:hypothetical protein